MVGGTGATGRRLREREALRAVRGTRARSRSTPLRSIWHVSDDAQRSTAAAGDLHGQGHDEHPCGRKLPEICDVLESGNVCFIQDHVGAEVLRLAVVEARGVDAERGDAPVADEPGGGVGVEAGKVELGDGAGADWGRGMETVGGRR